MRWCRVPGNELSSGVPDPRAVTCARVMHACAAPQVKKRFPDPETKLLIGCNDGRTYTMDALVALDEEGYTNLTGLKVRPLGLPSPCPCCPSQ